MNTIATHDESSPETGAELLSEKFRLVGLGASAGGIRALQTFFDGMPAENGMAFVVVMHLLPDHESILAQILQQRTAMPVIQVTEATSIAPNHVYVIPPNKHLAIQDSKITLTEPQQSVGRRVAIDLFFRSLSVAYGPRAVCVVLTGTDSDGVIGIKHVKEQGGITIVQDPTEAEFDSMPRGAIATGMVDWILPVAQMPNQLMEFMRNERRMHVPPENPPKTPGEQEEEARNSGGPLVIQQVPSLTDEDALSEVLRFLRGQTGHDFSHYKRATILRRVARRLQVNLLENIPSYLGFLRSHASEANDLLQDLLISVTNFFRDRDAFGALEAHIPQLFAGKNVSDCVRVWVAGCASGEEAYSVAILLSEHAARLEAPPSIQVFATDLDEDVIQAARAGLYPSTIEADVSPEQLRRYFQKDQGRYRIRKEVRERVLFSAHNLLRDSPFSRLDLITCRNLLIYLQREAQEGIFDIFHFALRPGGLLFLGSSENLDESHALFAPLDKRNRLYVRRSVPRPGWQVPLLPVPSPSAHALATPVLPRLLPSDFPTAASETAPANPTALSPPSLERRALLLGDMHLTLLERYAPPSVVVNANFDIVHLSEHAGRFLRLGGGEPSMNLLKVARPDLRLELRTALFLAVKDQTAITAESVWGEADGAQQRINIHVRPTPKTETESFILVVFEPVPAEAVPAASPLEAEPITRHLEAENQHLREQLGITVEQYEASVEELKASNEELQAMNEEMRSATEELETGKEELQSINEELSTVNYELKTSVEELSRTNSDLQNLMASTEIGTIFLDRDLRIKRFTPRAQELFNVIATDLDRPLSDITGRLSYGELMADAERALRDLRPIEREVHSEGRWFLGRILPYRMLDDRIDGVVLTFVDITQRRQAEDAVRISEERLRLMIENVADYALFTPDAEGRVASWNAGARRMLRYEAADILGKHFSVFYTESDRQSGVPHCTEAGARAAGQQEDEGWRVRRDGSTFWGNEIMTAVHDSGGALTGFIKIVRDLSQRRRAEEERALLLHETTLAGERNRMAQELHDTLAQGFTGISMQMAAAEQALGEPSEQTREALQHITRGRELARQSLLEARSAVRALRSPQTGDDGLPVVLERLAALNTGSVTVQFFAVGMPRVLSTAMEHDLYRIAQEAITNAMRHGQAQHVVVQLMYAPEQVRLTIQDDGRGFDARASRIGFGVMGMQERGARMGADLEINSQPGQGTEICVTLPFPAAPAASPA